MTNSVQWGRVGENASVRPYSNILNTLLSSLRKITTKMKQRVIFYNDLGLNNNPLNKGVSQFQITKILIKCTQFFVSPILFSYCYISILYDY